MWGQLHIYFYLALVFCLCVCLLRVSVMSCRELSPSPLEEQSVLSTAEPPLQPHSYPGHLRWVGNLWWEVGPWHFSRTASGIVWLSVTSCLYVLSTVVCSATCANPNQECFIRTISQNREHSHTEVAGTTWHCLLSLLCFLLGPPITPDLTFNLAVLKDKDQTALWLLPSWSLGLLLSSDHTAYTHAHTRTLGVSLSVCICRIIRWHFQDHLHPERAKSLTREVDIKVERRARRLWLLGSQVLKQFWKLRYSFVLFCFLETEHYYIALDGLEPRDTQKPTRKDDFCWGVIQI